jgi:hypothetical protein
MRPLGPEVRFSLCPVTTLPWKRRPHLCHPERTRISYFKALTIATYVVLPKENHMQLSEAAPLDRKSGGAEGSAVLRTFLGNVFRHTGAKRSGEICVFFQSHIQSNSQNFNIPGYHNSHSQPTHFGTVANTYKCWRVRA